MTRQVERPDRSGGATWCPLLHWQGFFKLCSEDKLRARDASPNNMQHLLAHQDSQHTPLSTTSRTTHTSCQISCICQRNCQQCLQIYIERRSRLQQRCFMFNRSVVRYEIYWTIDSLSHKILRPDAGGCDWITDYNLISDLLKGDETRLYPGRVEKSIVTLWCVDWILCWVIGEIKIVYHKQHQYLPFTNQFMHSEFHQSVDTLYIHRALNTLPHVPMC